MAARALRWRDRAAGSLTGCFSVSILDADIARSTFNNRRGSCQIFPGSPDHSSGRVDTSNRLSPPEDLPRTEQEVSQTTLTGRSQEIARIGPNGPETATEARSGSRNKVSVASDGGHDSASASSWAISGDNLE